MEPFTKPVDVTEFPTYEDIVVHPVDFTSLERNIKRKFYGSTEAFSSDARWIVHNSVIFNGGKILEVFFFLPLSFYNTYLPAVLHSHLFILFLILLNHLFHLPLSFHMLYGRSLPESDL